MQVAQAALAVLDVRLDAVARGACALMAGRPLGELGFDEGALAALDDLVAEAAHELIEQRPVAEDVAGVEQRRADGHVGARELQALVDGARRVTDLQAQIPEDVENVFDDALAPGSLLVGQQEQEIYVGARRQHGAAIAAGRDDGEPLRIRGIVAAIDVRACVVEDERDELIHERGQALGTAATLAVVQELRAGALACAHHELAQALDNGRPRQLGALIMRAEDGRQLVAEGGGVEIGRIGQPVGFPLWGQRILDQSIHAVRSCGPIAHSAVHHDRASRARIAQAPFIIQLMGGHSVFRPARE
ncbi:MAG: hypothetical protein ABS54_05835 [Hyphomicrobium sp. SCN 65-11]|nr:MAG: hypothetical protein ABS54_05835 [Hyphomicrobium sp. SCN 65-11]